MTVRRSLVLCISLFCCSSPDHVENTQSQVSAAPSGVVQTTPRTEVPGENTPDLPLRPLKVGGDVKAPHVIKQIPPEIPHVPEKKYRYSALIVEAIIDEHGRVREVRALNHEDSPYTQSYLEAVRKWEFQPGTLDGKPVPVVFNLVANHFPVRAVP